MQQLKFIYSKELESKLLDYRSKVSKIYNPNIRGKSELFCYAEIKRENVYHLIEFLGDDFKFEYMTEGDDDWPLSIESCRNGRDRHFDSSEHIANT